MMPPTAARCELPRIFLSTKFVNKGKKKVGLMLRLIGVIVVYGVAGSRVRRMQIDVDTR